MDTDMKSRTHPEMFFDAATLMLRNYLLESSQHFCYLDQYSVTLLEIKLMPKQQDIIIHYLHR